MKKKILVAEDEPSILTGLVDLLKQEGYNVFATLDGRDAVYMYEKEKPDLVILDIMMPEKSGYDVCREIRKKDSTTPILMLTAKSQEVDKVVGLELGADDYIIKPFGIKELLARIKGALRRACVQPQSQDTSVIDFGDISIDPKILKGKKGKREFSVTVREIQLLRFFLLRDGQVVRRFDLLNEVWGMQYEGTTRTLDQHIVKLRQKIEDDLSCPKYIVTVHGVGYQFFSKPKR